MLSSQAGFIHDHFLWWWLQIHWSEQSAKRIIEHDHGWYSDVIVIFAAA
jgi:hypothetical protein